MLSFLFLILFNGIIPSQPSAPAVTDYECPDLIILDIKLLERKKRALFIEYTLKNIGKSPAPLRKIKAIKSKKIGLRFHFSGDASLSRGDILADGTYIKKSSLPSEGYLPVDSTLVAKTKISLAKKNSYNNFLIAKIDPFSMLIECNESNNTFSILLD